MFMMNKTFPNPLAHNVVINSHYLNQKKMIHALTPINVIINHTLRHAKIGSQRMIAIY